DDAADEPVAVIGDLEELARLGQVGDGLHEHRLRHTGGGAALPQVAETVRSADRCEIRAAQERVLAHPWVPQVVVRVDHAHVASSTLRTAGSSSPSATRSCHSASGTSAATCRALPSTCAAPRIPSTTL